MIDQTLPRRSFLKAGAALGAAALPGLPLAAAALPADLPAGVDALLVDTGYGPAPETAARLISFAGDVTQVWFTQLDPRWRQPGFTLAGITGSDTLFVLETLARQHGRAVTHRSVLGAADARGVAPVSWVIAPSHKSVLA